MNQFKPDFSHYEKHEATLKELSHKLNQFDSIEEPYELLYKNHDQYNARINEPRDFAWGEMGLKPETTADESKN